MVSTVPIRSMLILPPALASRLTSGDDDRVPGALDDGHDLGPLGRRDCELVERLLRRAMTLQTMSFIFGAILLAVAILGGGFEIKEIKVSNVTVSVRIIAGIVGLFFIGVGFWPPAGRIGFRKPG
jgi:hypothetical protein